ncbi:MAG: methytransferase partner Trm112 [Thermoplasmata archaeon]
MKRTLMDILCCPLCKGDLALTVKKEEGREIVAGTLRCEKCSVDYPIEDGIPNLLPPEKK